MSSVEYQLDLDIDPKVLDKIKDKLDKAMKEACILVQDDAKRHCPVDTGRLQGSITHEVKKEGNDVVGIVGSDVEYAPYVEAGTYKMEARPFLKNAAEGNRDKIAQKFKDLV